MPIVRVTDTDLHLIDSGFTTPIHTLWAGTGIPDNHFIVSTNDQAGTQDLVFGLQVIHRQGPAYAGWTPTADGGNITVNSGLQIGNPNRAEWNWDWSVGVKNGGALAAVLAAHDIYQEIKYDGVRSDLFKLVDVAAVAPNNNGVPAHAEQLFWAKVLADGSLDSAHGITDDGQHSVGGAINVTQNSWNPAFELDAINASRAAHSNQAPLTLEQLTAHGHTIDVTLIEVTAGTDVSLIGVVTSEMALHAHISF